ncbi:MAG TPA: aminotransferase class III-fold pyridoxal phosphate-dependent enzyme [Gaiellaceae bacterium]|nr:aminotransferase class III-fold pyridoxal phosphate-dependent enzyme [Gaiellaceae bacterium]
MASEIESRYAERTPESASRAAEAAWFLPGGDTRSITWFRPHPLYVEEGRGCELLDVDGNAYIDLLLNYTSLVHGHAHPAITAAIAQQAARGTAFAAAHDGQVRLARLLCERVGSVERVRFCNSGTEAVMLALRLARAFTGRPLIAKVEGGYHGSWDGVEASVEPTLDRVGPFERPDVVPESAGLLPGATDSVVVLPFGDLAAANAILAPHAERLAAVIIEPVAGVAGTLPAERDYMHGLRALTRELGALLVLDEVITLRLSPGGAQALYDVEPDLTTMGKIIGGGLPVGAVGGREDVMALTDPGRPGFLPHSGTFNANAATTAAGVTALELLTAGECERLNKLGDRLREGIVALGDELGLGVTATGLGSLLTIHLLGEPPRSYREARRADSEAVRLLHLALLNEGVFAARRGLLCLGTPMGEEDVDRALVAVRHAVLAVHAERPLLGPAPVAV